MKTFTEFLMEATAPKKISFNSYVKDMFKTLSSIKGFSVKRKLSITSGKKESANFEIFKYLDGLPVIPDSSIKDKDEMDKELIARQDKVRNELKKEHEKLLQSILLILNYPPAAAKINRMYNTKFVHGEPVETSDTTFTDKKSGYQINVISTFRQSMGSLYSHFEINFEGNEIDQKGLTFTEFPEFIPGAILYSSWGYEMTINTFYEIVRRTNKTIYAVEIGNKKISGGGWTGKEIPDPSIREKEIFSGRINPGGYVKLDGHHCRLYDGKPKYYNSLD